MLNELVRRALVAERAAEYQRAAATQRLVKSSRQEHAVARRPFLASRRTRAASSAPVKGDLLLDR